MPTPLAAVRVQPTGGGRPTRADAVGRSRRVGRSRAPGRAGRRPRHPPPCTRAVATPPPRAQRAGPRARPPTACAVCRTGSGTGRIRRRSAGWRIATATGTGSAARASRGGPAGGQGRRGGGGAGGDCGLSGSGFDSRPEGGGTSLRHSTCTKRTEPAHMHGEISRPPSLKQIRQTASAGTSRDTGPPCVPAVPAAAAAPSAAAPSSTEAPVLTERSLTDRRCSGALARMTTTGHSATPSDESDAPLSHRTRPSWHTWKSPAQLGSPARLLIRCLSSPRVMASSSVTVELASLRAASITRQDMRARAPATGSAAF